MGNGFGMSSLSDAIDLKKIKNSQKKSLRNVYNFQKVADPKKNEFDCVVCFDKNIIVNKNKEGDLIGVECKCVKRKKEETNGKRREIENILNNEDLISIKTPKDFEDVKSFEDFKQTTEEDKSLKYSLDYVNRFQEIYFKKGIGLSFFGESGVGKSMLSYIIKKEVEDLKFEVLAVDVTKLSSDINNLYHKYRDTNCLISKLLKTDLLILDNLDLTKSNKQFINQIELIITYRTDFKKPIIINSIYNYEDLEVNLSKKVLNKLKSKNGSFVEMKGENFSNKKLEAIDEFRNSL